MRVTVDGVDVQPDVSKVALTIECGIRGQSASCRMSSQAARIIAQALIAAAEEVEDA